MGDIRDPVHDHADEAHADLSIDVPLAGFDRLHECLRRLRTLYQTWIDDDPHLRCTALQRAEHVVQCCFQGRRIVVFSGGEAKDLDGLFEEIRGLRDGGANGSIIGRNTFQRPREEALAMLQKIIDIYLNKA